MKIGFFDSGLGGLLVLKAVAKNLPDYDYEYYGDTKNLPYGDKTEEKIYELTKTGVEHLFKKNCALVVIACNTASSETLRRLQDEYLPEAYPNRKILGVIIPVVEEVIVSGCKRVLLLATKRTVSSGKYHLELGKRNEIKIKIESQSTPGLVGLIEKGLIGEAFLEVKTIINDRIGQGEGIDGLILGCTHYSLLTGMLRSEFGTKIKVFTQTEIIPKKLDQYLLEHSELEMLLSRVKERNILLTEHRGDYDEHIKELLGGHLLEEK